MALLRRYRCFNASKSIMRMFSMYSDTFSAIVSNRSSVMAFDPERSLPAEMLTTMLSQAQRSPSSFNLQPYKGVVIQSKDQKESVSAAMLGMNGQRILDASATVVFLALKEPTRNIKQLMELERSAGKPAEYVASLPAKTSFLAGAGVLATTLKHIATEILSTTRGKPMPRLETTECWSVKNTAFAAQTFMLSAASLGLVTCPMEGFDTRQLARVLNVDLNLYAIPLLVSVGYPATDGKVVHFDGASPRFAMDEVFYSDSMGTPLDLTPMQSKKEADEGKE